MIDLTEKRLPNVIEINGSLYSIETDFRLWMRFEIEVGKLKPGETMDVSYLFVEEMPACVSLNDLMGFARPKRVLPRSNGRNSDVIALDYELDSDLIVAAFLGQYGIDLTEVDNLHWHKFLANPSVLVTTLIAGLVAAIVYLWNTNEDFRTACIEIWNSITEAFSSAWNSLLKFINEIIPEMINDIKEWFSGLPDYFAEIGANIVDGIWNGISAGWDWLVSSVKNLASSLFGAAKDELDINSPSRKFKWLGEMCVAGWNEGSEDLFDTDTVTKDINATLSVAKAGVIGGGGGTGSGGLTQHIYVNKEVATPDEVARAIRVESRYGLIGGVAFE